MKNLLDNYKVNIDENLLKGEREKERRILDEPKSIGEEMRIEVEIKNDKKRTRSHRRYRQVR